MICRFFCIGIQMNFDIAIILQNYEFVFRIELNRANFNFAQFFHFHDLSRYINIFLFTKAQHRQCSAGKLKNCLVSCLGLYFGSVDYYFYLLCMGFVCYFAVVENCLHFISTLFVFAMERNFNFPTERKIKYTVCIHFILILMIVRVIYTDFVKLMRNHIKWIICLNHVHWHTKKPSSYTNNEDETKLYITVLTLASSKKKLFEIQRINDLLRDLMEQQIIRRENPVLPKLSQRIS